GLGEQKILKPIQHVEFSESLVKLYQETLHLSSNMVDTDIRPGDAYLILAAHSFIKAMQECEGSSDDIAVKHLVFKVATILEHGIEKSKANFQLKLLLIKIYNMLGATGASQTVYDKCDLKHIQLDPGTSDPLISSYKYGSLTRIPEFVDFRERLNNSLHFASVAAEQMLLDITVDVSSHSQLVDTVRQMDIDPIMDKINWKELCDNRDLRVMNSWEPRDKCLKTSANKENSCVNGEAAASTDTMHLADLTTQLEEEYKESSTYRNCKPPRLPLQGPDPSRVYLFLSGGYVPILVKHAQILQHIHSTVQGSAGDSENSSGVMIKECREQVEELVTSHLHYMEALQTSCLEIVPGVNPPALAHLHHLAQTLGIVAILLGCCFVILKPIKAGVAKKNKKRKEPVTLPDVVPQFTSYVGALTSLLQKFEKALADKYKLVKKTTEENIKKNYSSVNVSSSLTSPEEGRTVCEKVEQSYVKSLERLSFSIGNKLKYVLSLKL
ncbi:LOW QUALITY PROTEIN: N-alpha-acetyltransferase 25, NatB auxiliary subunit, partial [Penaeus vannamei]|uniref:LOW QUALITY PROTEIN: N-alpha-acetyltransferase 25, NatB auxiliary subunit n=1 Tax=Penaeus vannamei TaxID=6689 RepID=UPI00387F9EF1